MLVQILFYVLMFCNVINMAHLGLYIVGGNLYDIKRFRETKTAKKRVSRPIVSVIVPAHNEAVVIERTLRSIQSSTYRNLEIIVVDDGSTDSTAGVVRRYIARLPKSGLADYMAHGGRTAGLERHYIRQRIKRPNITLVRQRNMGKAAAMNNAIQNYAKGSLVMSLDADSILHPQAVERAVEYFKDPKVIGVAANVRVMDNKTLLGRLQRFEHLIGYRSKKFYTVTNTEFIIGGVASTYRKSALKQVGFYDTDTLTEDIGLSMKLIARKGNRDHRIIYASDVVAMTEGVQTYRQLMRQRYRWKMGSLQNLLKYSYLVANDDARKYSYGLTFYRLPMAFLSELMLILEPVILGYIVYLSVHYHTAAILLGAYLTITAYVLWTLWPDEYLSVKEKLRMSLEALEIYVLFYAMDIVQVNAIFRCLHQRKEIIKRSSGSTWISPVRSGQPMQVKA